MVVILNEISLIRHHNSKCMGNLEHFRFYIGNRYVPLCRNVSS
uniref:Uncharacterized protein n=1 Tax=Arundo donax TaxID=35708 RepID=A0A0A9HDP3_ARUDO